VAGFISEWWPTSNRNGGRHQIGIPGRIESEFAHSGEVVDCIENEPATYLLQFDDAAGVQHLELMSITELLETGQHEMKRFYFFRTRAELDKWTAWIDEPPQDRVVSLVKKK
jgi:hypothetical protein